MNVVIIIKSSYKYVKGFGSIGILTSILKIDTITVRHWKMRSVVSKKTKGSPCLKPKIMSSN